MPYEAYKLMHVAGVILLLLSIGGAIASGINGLDKATDKSRRLMVITHGVSLLLIFVAGFGLLARLGIGAPTMWPGWVWLKLGVWICLGALPVLLRRRPGLAAPLAAAIAVLAAVAAFSAIYKPFA